MCEKQDLAPSITLLGFLIAFMLGGLLGILVVLILPRISLFAAADAHWHCIICGSKVRNPEEEEKNISRTWILLPVGLGFSGLILIVLGFAFGYL